MGEIKQVLATQKIDDPLYAGHMRFESCEHIHFHWRDMRIVMTTDQLFGLARNAAASALEMFTHPEKAPPHEDSSLIHDPIPEPYLFQGEAKIEESGDGQVIHFHLGDTRFEWTPTMFFMVADMMRKAFEKMFFKMIPLDQINPYDHIHFPMYEEWVNVPGLDPVDRMKDWQEHIAGISALEKAICAGLHIQPIIITKTNDSPPYQCRDGYKRYMAYKKLGFIDIPSYVVSEEIALKMPQHVDTVHVKTL